MRHLFRLVLPAVLLVVTVPCRASCPLSRDREHTFTVRPGVFINYRETGAGNRTLLALHGFGASLDTWKEIEPELSREFRVFMPDLPGFGLSAKPPGFRYTFEEQADALLAFLKFISVETGGRPVT